MCGLTQLVLGLGLATSDGGLTPGGDLPQWEYGVPNGGTDAVWTTRLDAQALNDGTGTLDLALPDLSGLSRPVVVVDHSGTIGNGDVARFSVDSGSGFVPIAPVGGYPGGDGFRGTVARQRSGLELTGLSGPAVLRLEFATDVLDSDRGWTIHDIELFDGDPLPPQIEPLVSPVDNQEVNAAHRVEVSLLETDQLTQSVVRWSTPTDAGTAPLVQMGDRYIGDLPAFPADTRVDVEVEAADCHAATVLPLPSFRVFLAAPTALVAPNGPRVIGDRAELSWTPPESPWPILGYLVEHEVFGETESLSTVNPNAVLALEPGRVGEVVVRANYLVPGGETLGDATAPVVLDVEVPELEELSPSSVFPDDEVYVRLQGQSLYLAQGQSTFDFGPGVQVVESEVQNVDRARVRVRIDSDAAPGPRTVRIGGTQGVVGFDAHFEVATGEAPRVEEVFPARVVQGSELSVTIRASQPWGTPVRLTVDDDLVVTSDTQVDGAALSFRIAALARATPGSHTVIIDDGERLWRAELEVAAFLVEQNGCSSTPLPKLAWLWSAIVGFGWRRRSPSRGIVQTNCETTWPSQR